MKKLHFYRLVLVVFFALCGTKAYAGEPLRVVASFSILGDMVRQIGGDEVDLTVLVGAGQDPHGFEPYPAQVAALSKADIIVINGLSFEPWMDRLIKASQTQAKLLVASAKITPRWLEDSKRPDPHAWLDLTMAQQYVRNIASALMAARPAQADFFRQRALVYNERLLNLHNQAKAALAAIPQERRKAVVEHAAFDYLGAAYGIRFYALQSGGPQEPPSYNAIQNLVEAIKKKDIKFAFPQAMEDSRLLQQIAKETGISLGGAFYADALGPNKSYEAMMQSNFKTILAALGQKQASF